MPIDKIVDILVPITLIEMMVTIGLGVTVQQVMDVAKNWHLVGRATVANYVLVPAAAIALLLLYHAPPLIGAGFLMAAACPGAPYGPPLTAMAKGDVSVAVGLMAVLAGSSAVLAPLVLRIVLPLTSGNQDLVIDVPKMVGTLVVTQLLPMGVGMMVRAARPGLADALLTPAKRLGLVLNLVVFALILTVHYPTLLQVRPSGFLGMAVLALGCVAFGWLLGGGSGGDRTAMAFSTGVRNAGVSLVIATASFPGTPAVTAALIYALFQTILLALLAAGCGRLMRDGRTRLAKA